MKKARARERLSRVKSKELKDLARLLVRRPTKRKVQLTTPANIRFFIFYATGGIIQVLVLYKYW